MRKVLIVICAFILLALFAFSVQFFLIRSKGKGALQVTSSPKSAIYLNGKQIGSTPLCKCEPQDMIATGDYTIRLVSADSTDQAFEKKISIQKSVLTVVDHTFGQGTTSEGSIITLSPLRNQKDVELLVLSFPDKAEVFLDNSMSGTTPLLIKNITASDHEVKLTKTGYKEKIIRIKTTNGFKLESTVFLGVNPMDEPKPSASPSATPVKKQLIRILQTPTGFLRVRKENSIISLEVGRVNPGESYEMLDEKEGWYKIKVTNDIEGWVSANYAEKQQ